jgi:hypothetical protein
MRLISRFPFHLELPFITSQETPKAYPYESENRVPAGLREVQPTDATDE